MSKIASMGRVTADSPPPIVARSVKPRIASPFGVKRASVRMSGGDDEIMNFLNAYVGKFDMYVEDEYAVFVRYCFSDPLDAAIFRSRFEYRASRFKLAG